MPWKPELKEKTPEQKLSDRKLILQMAYDLGSFKGMDRFGPEGQKLFDFLYAVGNYGDQAIEGEQKRQKDSRSEDDGPIVKRQKSKDEYTRGEVLKELGDYNTSLYFKLTSLAGSLHAGDYEKAKKQLPFIEKDLDDFSRTYQMYKESMPEMIQKDPVLLKFDKLWEERNCPVGEQLLDRLDGKNLDQPLEIPEEPKEFNFTENESVKEEDVPVFQINDEVIQAQRADNKLNQPRHYRDVYAPGKDSYEAVLGNCENQWKKREFEPVSGKDLLATALAAAQLRKEGAPFNLANVKTRAGEILNEPAFSAMTQNEDFVSDCLEDPRMMDDALKVYEKEAKAQRMPETGEKSYEGYLRRHTWPNVPEGKEREYLAKAIAARRLREHGTPFDLAVIREEANNLSKQTAFRRLTEEATRADENVRRWLHEDKLDIGDMTIQHLRRSLRAKNSKEPHDPNVKSWAGYRRMHTGENVPQNASLEEKRLYLAKAMVAVRGMSDDKPFSLKAARKAAAVLVKNKYFREITRDPQKLSEVLAADKVTSMFGKMTDARRKAMGGFSKEKELMEYRNSIAPIGEENPAPSRRGSESEPGNEPEGIREDNKIIEPAPGRRLQ